MTRNPVHELSLEICMKLTFRKMHQRNIEEKDIFTFDIILARKTEIRKLEKKQAYSHVRISCLLNVQYTQRKTFRKLLYKHFRLIDKTVPNESLYLPRTLKSTGCQ